MLVVDFPAAAAVAAVSGLWAAGGSWAAAARPQPQPPAASCTRRAACSWRPRT